MSLTLEAKRAMAQYFTDTTASLDAEAAEEVIVATYTEGYSKVVIVATGEAGNIQLTVDGLVQTGGTLRYVYYTLTPASPAQTVPLTITTYGCADLRVTATNKHASAQVITIETAIYVD